MSQTKTIRLLILNDSRSEAERLISMLHNAGRPVRAQHVDSEEALNKLLQEKVWDLMIGLDSSKSFKPLEAIRLIQRLNKDVPFLLQTDNEGTQPVVEGLKMGAVDVVRVDEDQHLLLVIQREYNSREQRDQRRFAERRHKEIERRNQQLLDSSRDAIAFIQDGMFLYVNESFTELFGQENRDELECMPVIDVIHEKDQDKVKRFLKEFTLKGSEVDTTTLEFCVAMDDGSQRPLKVDVRKSSYDEELCIQFLIRTSSANSEELEAQLAQIKSQDLATGLFNKNYLLDALHLAVDQSENLNSALYCIGISKFNETVTTKLGVASSDIVLGSVAAYAKTLTSKDDVLCRYGENTFMLLTQNVAADGALKRAQELCKQLTDHIVDVDGSTLQFHYAIGVSVINETTANGEMPINQALKALKAAAGDADKTELPVKLYEPESKKEQKKDISNMVQRAIESGRFKLLYQPILSLRGSEKEHYEVLLRMVDDEGSEISPNEFLSAASKIGATTKIDRWVVLESIKILSEHRKNGNQTHLIVNLSRESMLDSTLPPWLAVAFKAAGLPSDAIIFQLAEIDINDHLNVAASFTEQINKIGSSCSVSRFGCALNPMNALNHVTCSHVKIDGSFTQELQSSNEDAAQAINEIVSELHQHDKITIVPFVENASVLSKLWQSGVHYIQGYYLQGPTDAMNYDFDTES
ncbi:PAS domain S-box-containing protein/diguanylate cyclase (GGDEF) domain-containing protein [Alteromonadaceae bacterium Bs31]|nr:PAS domain S-box-containing protein/diguanylate cyclase (GGDEF) domain-containing protein [Alteromonadaceae bacterium Bs31]